MNSKRRRQTWTSVRASKVVELEKKNTELEEKLAERVTEIGKLNYKREDAEIQWKAQIEAL